MPSIPVIHSIPDGRALMTTVLPEYLIPQPHSCKLYKRGLNDTYLVETEVEKYILRIYRRSWRNKQEIDFELALLGFLHEQKQQVAYPIHNKNYSLTTEILAPEGVRYATLFIYALGHAVNEQLDAEQSYILGKTLAKIHYTLDDFQTLFIRPVLNNEYLFDWSITAIKSLYKHRKDDINCLQEIINNIKN